MILSHRHRFIFIKGVKVAGTSIEIALSQLCGPDDIITPVTPIDERLRLGTPGEPRNYSIDRHLERDFLRAISRSPVEELAKVRAPRGTFANHMALSEVLRAVPEAAGYRLLFAERSPYEKVISQAHWRSHRGRYEIGRGLPEVPGAIADAVQQAIDDRAILNVRNIDRYRSPDGAIASAGWRYETLGASVAGFMAECGMTGIAIPHAKRGVESSQLDPAIVLRPAQVAYINREFEDEFRTFGYPTIE